MVADELFVLGGDQHLELFIVVLHVVGEVDFEGGGVEGFVFAGQEHEVQVRVVELKHAGLLRFRVGGAGPMDLGLRRDQRLFVVILVEALEVGGKVAADVDDEAAAGALQHVLLPEVDYVVCGGWEGSVVLTDGELVGEVEVLLEEGVALVELEEGLLVEEDEELLEEADDDFELGLFIILVEFHELLEFDGPNFCLNRLPVLVGGQLEHDAG